MATKNEGSPLGDGSSGAGGNGAAGTNRRPESGPRQQMGSCRNPDSVARGGPNLEIDPPGDRQEMVGTTADPGQRRAFKLGGGTAAAPEDDVDEDPGPVGGAPEEDSQD